MSTTSLTTNEYNLLSAAESTAKSSAATSGSSSSSSSSTSSTAALSSLANNYTTFLTLLTTQLQHQDPSSPMSSDSFTSELVQFAGVEQQVQTNSKLSSLISLNESGQLSADSALVGSQATANSTTLPLQNSSATLNYKGSSGQTVAIAVSNSAGTIVKDDLVTASSGTNTWTWDGTDNNGNKLSDGAYSVAVKTMDSSGNTSDVSFTVTGTITGIQTGTNDMEVQMGGATIPMSQLVNVSSTSKSSSSSSSSSSSDTDTDTSSTGS
ncbi:flagellar biosynthesis protein FlgD [Acetobacter fabarum]|jgi:flagellar basal-body rod modification protein FlgD|uniref:flagellar hook assembly protein FlgD n=1 Tax=Acetobacter TaxID=434 RepID=UPI000A369A87|nr:MULTISPECIES: flagellar hook capping FlgD N-terminal domain-containing protein [Acetobacter]MCP1228219.1 flagellar biosynthesis protein FlgD [Acetobacter fabarum]MCP1233715.1 flagellar biosynthesis protein FlgD [Acetobacter fabarum]NHO42043.1 flagellar biosynthesis protein FlgD [Acetobacter fabarum]OUI98113.1 flagellar basal body rod modification protein FlgD [Acetobacter sp. DsW_54]GBQ34188.1 basal-body rod modification protein FlgD [Acetobacter fabarum DSM 19596]